ncbi:MAG: type IV pilus modification protein PilV [Woeseiaceae bacterium]|jgi:type IV pilus assembly protein PilV|nr:type IV pilus modification protein PilV [Woeseiaceae bacterium]
MPRITPTQRRQAAFSLIEMLIALIIFSVGLLAIAGLQTVSKQANYESLQRTSASQIAYGLLEDMRVNGGAANVYIAAGELGGGSRGGEPAPNCRGAAVCNATQKALHDLWFWEQILDGNQETSGGAGAGGLLLPTLCVQGPAGGGAGMYVVSIAWRGSASINNAVNNPCGGASGNYGDNNEFRRILQIPTFIDPNI